MSRGRPAAVRGAEPRGQPGAAQRPAAGVRAPLRAHDRPAADRGHRELDRRRGAVRVRRLAGRPDRGAGDRVAEPGPVGARAGVAAPVRGAAAGCFRCARPRGVRRAGAAAAAGAGDRHRPRQPDRRRVRARSGRGARRAGEAGDAPRVPRDGRPARRQPAPGGVADTGAGGRVRGRSGGSRGRRCSAPRSPTSRALPTRSWGSSGRSGGC